MASQVRQGIHTSLRQILDKRVLPSLSPLMDNQKLDKELQLMLHETFPEFCRAAQNSSPPNVDGVKSEDLDGEVEALTPQSLPPDPSEPSFSDDEDQDDIPIGTIDHVLFTNADYIRSIAAKKIEIKKANANSTRSIPTPLLEITSTLNQLDDDVKGFVESLLSDTDSEAR